MSGLVYFIETDKNALTEDDVKAAGLERVYRPGWGQCAARDGPGGKVGISVAFPAEHPEGAQARAAYKREDQEWFKADGGRYWIGYYKDARPRPVDLARVQQLPGYWLKMEDGELWQVPVARHFAVGSPLPVGIRLAANGAPEEVPLERFAAYSADAERIFRAVCTSGQVREAATEMGYSAEWNGEEPELTLTDRMRWCATAMGFNYRVTEWELSALQLLSTESMEAIERAIIDLPAFSEVLRDWLEKKQAGTPDGSPSSAGAPVS